MTDVNLGRRQIGGFLEQKFLDILPLNALHSVHFGTRSTLM